MLIRNKQIAIVGGGPGGLTLARLLQLKGSNVTVYERDLNKNARVQGSPLDMHEASGWAALKKADLLDEFNKHVLVGADKKIVVNEQAEVLFSDHDDINRHTSWPEIERGELRKILMESLKPDTVVWDSHFILMKKQGNGWQLHFKNGTSAYADIVIAADGANSKIRPYITDIKPFYSDITMIEINIPDAFKTAPKIYRLLNGGKVMAFGNGKNILGGQKGKADLGFYLSLKIPEGWATNNGLDYSDKSQLLTWFKQEYAGWDNIWWELIENAILPIIPRPIHCMPLNQTWQTHPNVTMIGDAAHVMPPFAGEGANMAMLDALELFQDLTSGTFPTVHDALINYETDMRERAVLAMHQSLENGELMHSAVALEKMLTIFGRK